MPGIHYHPDRELAPNGGRSRADEDRNAAQLLAITERGVPRLFLEVTADEAGVVHPEHGEITLPRGIDRVWRQRERCFLHCRCPATGRAYLLRVPPEMATCREAAAWLAGFDDPARYQPLQET